MLCELSASCYDANADASRERLIKAMISSTDTSPSPSLRGGGRVRGETWVSEGIWDKALLARVRDSASCGGHSMQRWGEGSSILTYPLP